MARLALVAIILCSCGGKTSEPVGDPLLTRVPKVDSAALTIAPPATTRMPLLVYVEEDGKATAGVGPESWSALASFRPAKSAQAIDGRMWPHLREDVALGRPPHQILEELKEIGSSDIDLDLALPEDTTARRPSGAQDDPPPPEEEDKPDDGEDESGGTGTAMALEEGKMGKKDSDRAEGQYKMQKNSDDPALARQQARLRALPGPRGRVSAFASLTGRKDYPERLATVSGAIEDPKYPMPEVGVAIAAHPKAKALALIEALTETEGALLVAHGQDVRPLRLLFGPGSHTDLTNPRWIELRVSAKEVAVELVPNTPIIVPATAPLTELAKAFTTLRSKYPAATTTEVLVASGVDAQRLVDVLVTLDTAGARSISLGIAPAPTGPQGKLRGKRIVELVVGRPSSQGVIDNVEIRRAVRDNEDKLRACYESQLATQPDLAGEVSVQFLIDAKGKVQTATATGVEPTVASCMAGVIKAVQFPAPSDKGKTQVSLPIAIR